MLMTTVYVNIGPTFLVPMEICCFLRLCLEGPCQYFFIKITYNSYSISQHYGAVCCYSCRAFFRRGITRSYVCVRGDDLCQVGVSMLSKQVQRYCIGLNMQVNSITRTNCKRCRYARCLAVGMKPELVDATLKRKQVSAFCLSV